MTPAQVLREKLGAIRERVEDGYVDTIIHEDIPALLDVVEILLNGLEDCKDLVPSNLMITEAFGYRKVPKIISQAAERLNEGRE